jgi:hypothetical protein
LHGHSPVWLHDTIEKNTLDSMAFRVQI